MNRIEGQPGGGIKVSVIILTYNEEKNIGPCLEAVFGQNYAKGFEVIVVDSGSTDDTLDIVKSFPARLLEIPRKDFSHGGTRQWAAEHAEGEYLAYLVADALPADKDWLSALIEPMENDESIAGTYSRQTARPGAHPVEEDRIKQRTAGGGEEIIRHIPNIEEYLGLKPADKLRISDFDDVSSCRRLSVLREIPIPDVAWAEDLFWSHQALKAGYKIAYAPGSRVIHSHDPGYLHAFRRGWLDQRATAELFGMIYFENATELFRKYFLLLYRRWGIILRSGHGVLKKLGYLLTQPLWLFLEVIGNFLASRRLREEAVHYDFRRRLSRARLYPPDASARVMRTWFTDSNGQRPVIFANPDARVTFNVRVPVDSFLRFGAGINPEAWPKRQGHVAFAVEIDGKRVWESSIGPMKPGSFTWQDAEIDLKEFSGKNIEISFITSADNTDHAWAGWAEPRVSSPALRSSDRLFNHMLELVSQRLSSSPLRHP